MAELKVKQINGEVLTVTLENGFETLVREVKLKLTALTGVDSERQRLIYTGRVLKDEDKLKDYGISEESTIQFVVRPQDAIPTSTSTASSSSSSSSTATTGESSSALLSPPQFRNLGNGVVLGSVAIDAGREDVQFQQIIGQMMNLAQSFLSPPPPVSDNNINHSNATATSSATSSTSSAPSTTQPRPSSSTTSTTARLLQQNRSSSVPSDNSSRNNAHQSTTSTLPTDSLASAHLNAILQMLPNASPSSSSQSSSSSSPNLGMVLNDFFRVLNALQVPVVNLSREIPPNFDESMVSNLSGNALTQIIQLSHILRSLSTAASHLSTSLDRITGTSLEAPPESVTMNSNYSSHATQNLDIFDELEEKSNELQQAPPSPMPMPQQQEQEQEQGQGRGEISDQHRSLDEVILEDVFLDNNDDEVD